MVMIMTGGRRTKRRLNRSKKEENNDQKRNAYLFFSPAGITKEKDQDLRRKDIQTKQISK